MLEDGWGRELLIFLATAGIVVPLFGRLRFGVVAGFLIAGVALGPGGLGHLAGDFPWLRWITFSDPERVRPFAELGVVFLLFRHRPRILHRPAVGDAPLCARRRLDPGRRRRRRRSWPARSRSAPSRSLALVIGLALALSSTAIVTQVLLDARRFGRPVGPVSLGVLLFQDLMVVPIVIIVELLGGGEVAATGAVLRAIALAVAAVAGILLAGRYLTRPLLRIAAGTGNRDLVIAIALFLAIGTAVLTAGGRAVPGARRLPRRAAPRRERIPASARGRCRAVQGAAARPLLHDRRDEHRRRCASGGPAHLPRRGGGAGRREGGGGLRARRASMRIETAGVDRDGTPPRRCGRIRLRGLRHRLAERPARCGPRRSS